MLRSPLESTRNEPRSDANMRPNLGSMNDISSIKEPKAPRFFKTYSRKRPGNPPPKVEPKKKRYNGTKFNIFETIRYVYTIIGLDISCKHCGNLRIFCHSDFT